MAKKSKRKRSHPQGGKRKRIKTYKSGNFQTSTSISSYLKKDLLKSLALSSLAILALLTVYWIQK